MPFYDKHINKAQASSDNRPFRLFQIRWREKLGEQDNPYLIRWTFLLFGYSVRIHHWLRNDASTLHYHDHASDLLSIVLYGEYNNVVPYDTAHEPNDVVQYNGKAEINKCRIHVEGMFNSFHNVRQFTKSIWKTSHKTQHYLEIIKPTWTLMFEGRPIHKWGFFVKGFRKKETNKWSPKKYFNRFGIYVNEINNENYFNKKW